MNIENTTIENAEEVAQIPLSGPGERLRAARLALDIDVKKVARQLRLTPDVVEALEQDDYTGMTARVFVRGYILNYARFVELPVDSVLAQFDQLWPDDVRPVKLSQPPKLPSDSRLNKRWSRIINGFLLLLIVVLFFVWWQGNFDKFVDANDVSSLISTPGEPVPSSSQQPFSQPDQQSAETQVLQIAEPTVQLDQQSVVLPAIAPVENVENTEVQVPQVAQVAELMLQEPAPAIVNEQAVTVETDTPQEQVQTEQTETVAESAEQSTEVYISFNGSCWVDIRDSQRRFKLLGEMQQGDKYKLDGVPPYDVVLGNAAAASITVDGKNFDIDPYIKGNVARFTLTP